MRSSFLHIYFAPGDLTTKERTDAAQAGFDQWVHATHGIDGHSDDQGDLMYAVLTRAPTGELPLHAHTITVRDLNTLKVCHPAFVVPPS